MSWHEQHQWDRAFKKFYPWDTWAGDGWCDNSTASAQHMHDTWTGDGWWENSDASAQSRGWAIRLPRAPTVEDRLPHKVHDEIYVAIFRDHIQYAAYEVATA